MRYCMAMVGLLVCSLLAPLNARADTLTIAPSDDAYVRARAATANFGAADFLDSQGGSNSYTCGADSQQLVGQAYSYLKFDLSKIPAGAKIESVELLMTSRTGYAFGGDPDQHLRFVPDDNWSESKLTYRNAPVAENDNLDSRTFSYEAPVCRDPKGDLQQFAFEGDPVTAAVTSERSGDGKLSLEIFNENCSECSGTPNAGNWVRFFSKEADNANYRPQLSVTYSPALQPVLYDAVPDAATNRTTVVGRVTGPPSTLLTLRFSSNPVCTDGKLGGDSTFLGTLYEVATDENGDAYFAQTLAGLPQPGWFVAMTAQTPDETISPLSRCVAAPDNDIWPRARELHLRRGREESPKLSAGVQQSLDVDGQVRWYAFDVAPDSQLTFDLTQLPANY